MNWLDIENCVEQLTNDIVSSPDKSPTDNAEHFLIKARETALQDIPFARRAQFSHNPEAMREDIAAALTKRAYLSDFRRNMLSHFGKLKTVKSEVSLFFSYRRSEAEDLVRHISDKLKEHSGIHMFIDQHTLLSGPFPEGLGDQVRAADILVLLVYPTTMEKLTDPEDWVRKEIETALEANKLILPLRIDGAPFPGHSKLPQSLEQLKFCNALEFSTSYFDNAIERLVSWIDKAEF